MESVDAFVVAKQQGMIQQQIPNAGDATGGHGFTLQEQPWYKITFRLTAQKRNLMLIINHLES